MANKGIALKFAALAFALRALAPRAVAGFAFDQALKNVPPPKKTFDIPFAAANSPKWPLISNHPKNYLVSYQGEAGKILGNGARRFMADRGDKYHAGVDLYAYHGDAVVAAESGVIVNMYHFYHGSYALIVQNDSGTVINYGEVENGSWKEFNKKIGSRVTRGEPIARIGTMSGGGSMLHFETYAKGTKQNIRFFGGTPNPKMRNPTQYLLLASVLSKPQGVSAPLPGSSIDTGPDSVENEMAAPPLPGVVVGQEEGDGP